MGADPILRFIVELSIALTFILWVQAMDIITYSRNFFAWSMDRLFPSVFAKVDKRFHSPYVAILLPAIPSALIVLVTVLGVNMYAWTAAGYFMHQIIWLIASIAATVFPYVTRVRHIWETSPLRTKIAGIPAITIIGLISSAFWVYTISIFITNPWWYTMFGLGTWMARSFIVISFVAPIVYYYIRRWHLRTKGIDLDAAYREVPPA
ncbi:MAG: hypothetical protein ACTSYO_03045 [Candidatus Ranarchaeia archaeon]